MRNIEHRLHWHRADPEPPERVVFWRGGIRRDLPRWEQEYVRADLHQGAVDTLVKIANGVDDGKNLAVSAIRRNARRALEAMGVDPSAYRGQCGASVASPRLRVERKEPSDG